MYNQAALLSNYKLLEGFRNANVVIALFVLGTYWHDSANLDCNELQAFLFNVRAL
jgi:hypothetical protein